MYVKKCMHKQNHLKKYSIANKLLANVWKLSSANPIDIKWRMNRMVTDILNLVKKGMTFMDSFHTGFFSAS